MAHETMTQEECYPKQERLYVAFELSKAKWRVKCSVGGKKRISGSMNPGNKSDLVSILRRAKKKFDLSEDVQLLSCIEAGRDGFWPHRFLEQQGFENVVVDPASIKVSRRGRRAKTDKIDVEKLLTELVRFHRGDDDDVFRTAHVPSHEDENDRHVHRELQQLQNSRQRERNRVRSLLATEGVKLPGDLMKALASVEELRTWSGDALPAMMVHRLVSKREQLQLYEAQIKEIVDFQVASAKAAQTEKMEKIAKLMTLRGIAVRTSWIVVMESLGWKKFKNRKQVGASIGLCGTPYNTGESEREQGISKAANKRLRTKMIEIAWFWVRYQPDSSITKWFEKKFGGQSKRSRRVGIVGVARKLMSQFWHFLEHDVDPPGAIFS